MRSNLALLAGLAAISALGWSPSALADALSDARTHYAAVRNDATCPQAVAGAFAFASSPAFAELNADVQSTLLYQILHCAWRSENAELALASADLAVARNAEWARRVRFAVAVSFENSTVALSAFEALSPSEITALESWPIWRAIRLANDADPSGATTLAIHERLLAVSYQPTEGHDDSLRLDHARLLLREGNTARALDRMRGIVSASSWLSVRVDRTFDPVRAQLESEGRLDLAAAAEAELARARDDVISNPRKLWPYMDVVGLLRTLGRSQEALNELQPILRRAQARDAAEKFDDLADQLNWLLNEEAYALYDLGRAEEARVAFRFSILAREDGEQSVSQVINFASMLEKEGRAQEALDTLAEVGRASPYGDMWIASVRACSAEQLGRAELRDQSLAFLREHEADNVSALSAALLCVNAIDEAAALFIRRLGDAEDREGALIALQNFRENRRRERALPRTRVIADRLDLIRARPDVRAAVAEAGRIEDLPLHATYWGDY